MKAREKGIIIPYKVEDLISIDEDCENLQQLISELSRPKRIYNENGKTLVESKKAMRKRGVKSPNCADSFVIAFSVSAAQMKAFFEKRFQSRKTKVRRSRDHMRV